MAPTKNKPQKPAFNIKSTVIIDTIKKYVFDPHFIAPACFLLFFVEILLNIYIIERVKYTEIDWIAYMQEVEGFLNGTLDYAKLKGDTGPLVYPAGFVYIYSLFYYVTSQGRNIYLAQYIFMLIYLAQISLFYRILYKTAKIPPYALILTTLTSYRIHSIYVLRLFNDPIAVLLFYISLNLFISNKWIAGSIFYSLAVSVKMNILLYAPALLIAYLTNLTLLETFLNLAICGLIQLILGAPFIIENAVNYLRGSFDLGRIFEHKWTVNYRFMPREIFENRAFHITLLTLHISLLLLFTPPFKRYLRSFAKLSPITREVKAQLRQEQQRRREEKLKQDSQFSKKQREFLAEFEKQLQGGSVKTDDDVFEEQLKVQEKMSKVSQLLVLPFFVANLIGIACARSLHYQFYSWYFHSLVYLAFSTGYRKPIAFLILGVLELCWNTYPSTELSSAAMHLCHLLLVYGVYRTMSC